MPPTTILKERVISVSKAEVRKDEERKRKAAEQIAAQARLERFFDTADEINARVKRLTEAVGTDEEGYGNLIPVCEAPDNTSGFTHVSARVWQRIDNTEEAQFTQSSIVYIAHGEDVGERLIHGETTYDFYRRGYEVSVPATTEVVKKLRREFREQDSFMEDVAQLEAVVFPPAEVNQV